MQQWTRQIQRERLALPYNSLKFYKLFARRVKGREAKTVVLLTPSNVFSLVFKDAFRFSNIVPALCLFLHFYNRCCDFE